MLLYLETFVWVCLVIVIDCMFCIYFVYELLSLEVLVVLCLLLVFSVVLFVDCVGECLLFNSVGIFFMWLYCPLICFAFSCLLLRLRSLACGLVVVVLDSIAFALDFWGWFWLDVCLLLCFYWLFMVCWLFSCLFCVTINSVSCFLGFWCFVVLLVVTFMICFAYLVLCLCSFVLFVSEWCLQIVIALVLLWVLITVCFAVWLTLFGVGIRRLLVKLLCCVIWYGVCLWRYGCGLVWLWLIDGGWLRLFGYFVACCTW